MVDEVKSEEVSKKESSRSEITAYFTFCVIICCFGSAFQAGWTLGMFNTPAKALRHFFNETYYHRNAEYMTVSKWDALWGVSNGLLPLGSLFGSLFSGPLANKIGRKYTLLLTNFIVLLSGGIMILARYAASYHVFIAGHFVAGVHVGLFYTVGPIYLSEISTKNLRGACGSFHLVFMAGGTALSNIFGWNHIFGIPSLWPLIIVASFVPVLVQLLIFPFCVESPKFTYINKNDKIQAEKILRKLRRTTDDANFVRQELEELEMEKQLSVSKFSYHELFSKVENQRPLLIACVIHASYHLSGINMMTFYSTKMFISMGLDANTWAIYATVLISAFKGLAGFICVFLVDRVGRRKLLLSGYAGMVISCIGLALLPILGTALWVEICIVIAAFVYILSFGIGPGPITWLVTSELFPSESRGHASSVAIAVHSFSSLLTNASIPSLMEVIDEYIFLLFAILICLFAVFIYARLPETKKRTIEEIRRNFQT